MEEKCQRCLKNEISLQCLHCPTINKICSLCDKKIHNSTSKINHTRIPKENITINIKENIFPENNREPNENHILNKNKDIKIIENNQKQIEDDDNNYMNYNNIKNISSIMKNNNSSVIIDNNILNNNTYDISTVNQSMNNNNINECLLDKYNKTAYFLNNNQNQSPKDIQQVSFSNENKNINNYKYIEKNDFGAQNKEKINNNSYNISNSVFNKKLLIADNYSKEYINEIKKIFKKEKEQLEYKNKVLEMSINRLKIEFNEQISYLTNELKNNQSNNIINIQAIKENYQNKIDEIKKNNEIEVCSLKEEIFNFENDKKELNNSYLVEINEKKILIQNLENENEQLKNELNLKNNEIEKLKNSFEEITLQYENKYEDDKKQIINDYEQKIEKIVESVENSKNSLINLIDKREKDIKEVLEQKNEEIKILNIDINKLKDELNCHKTNLIRIRDEKNRLLKENQIIKNRNFQNECNEQVQISEINNLKKENEDLYQQIDKLKIELSKLDKMIYGKVRTNF